MEFLVLMFLGGFAAFSIGFVNHIFEQEVEKLIEKTGSSRRVSWILLLPLIQSLVDGCEEITWALFERSVKRIAHVVSGAIFGYLLGFALAHFVDWPFIGLAPYGLAVAGAALMFSRQD